MALKKGNKNIPGKKKAPAVLKEENEPVVRKIMENRPAVRMDENFARALKSELLTEYSRKSARRNVIGSFLLKLKGSHFPAKTMPLFEEKNVMPPSRGMPKRSRGMFAGLAGALAAVAIVGVTLFINRDIFIQKKPAIIEERSAYDDITAPVIARERTEAKADDVRMKRSPLRSETAPQGGNEKEKKGPAPEARSETANVLQSPAPEMSGQAEADRSLAADNVSAESSGVNAKKSLSASFKDESASTVRPVKNLDEICASWVPVRGYFASADTVLIANSNGVISYYSFTQGSLTGRGQLFMKDRSVYLIPEGKGRTNVYSNFAVSNSYLYMYRPGGQAELLKKPGE